MIFNSVKCYNFMRMNKTKWAILGSIILLSVIMVFSLNKKPKTTVQTTPSTDKKAQTFLIEGYPIEKVPLYKQSKVSSNKIFVNTDPKNLSEFDENNFSYFNVVFYTDASQEEFFDYYKKLSKSRGKNA